MLMEGRKMLFLKCPECGGKVKARQEMKTPGGPIHGIKHLTEKIPVLIPVTLAVAAGAPIYERVPIGGWKKCASCGHEFR